MMRLTAAAALVCVTLAVLWAGQGLSGEKDPPVKAKGQLPPNWKKLGLSADQVQKIYGIQTEYRTKVQKLEAEIKQLRQRERSEMFQVLTDDQKAKLRKILEGSPPEVKDKAPAVKKDKG
jgi:hypothetical protein